MNSVGKEEFLSVVAHLEFTPERRRMSVLVRGEGGEYMLMSKGADQMIQPLLAKNDPTTQEAVRAVPFH